MQSVSAGVGGLLLLLSMGLSQAGAATVSAEGGKVLVNTGSGFSDSCRQIVKVPPGTQVLVGQAGSALITYAGDCAVRVPSGRMERSGAPALSARHKPH